MRNEERPVRICALGCVGHFAWLHLWRDTLELLSNTQTVVTFLETEYLIPLKFCF